MYIETQIAKYNRICVKLCLSFHVHYYPRSHVWELRILVSDWSDSGEYSCKTNTVPGRQEVFQLRVKDTVAVIGGAKERILKEGSRNMEGWLSVLKTTPQHSGNYSCVPSYTTPDWVVVYVIPGDIFLLILCAFLHHT